MQSHLHRVRRELGSRTREQVREEIVRWWLEEASGDANTRHIYRYDVERLSSGDMVYLTRPARLNKGMDFVINCENYLKYKNGNDRPPSHHDISSELASIVPRLRSSELASLRTALRLIWECVPPGEALEQVGLAERSLELERACVVLPWLLIEQDLTYWTESGRWMLRGHIELVTGPLDWLGNHDTLGTRGA